MSDHKQRIHTLKQLILKYNRHYYELNTSLVEDSEYDSLFKELQTLEKQYPLLADSDSPTQQIGTNPAQGFLSSRHRSPMLSLDNAFREKELEDFDHRIRSILKLKPDEVIHYICEPKIDGVAVNLLYHKGKLIKGSTRGDGQVGENITRNLRTIKSIPIQLTGAAYPEWLEIRGEVYLAKKDFQSLNENLRQEKQKPFINPRNAASGSLRQLNASITSNRSLSFFAHGYGNIYDFAQKITHHSEMLQQFTLWNIPYPPIIEVVSDIDSCIAFYKRISQIRETLPYEIDGIVYKVNNLSYQVKLSNSTRAPRWAIAHKFLAEERTTKILAIEFQVGKTGILTPVAHLEPVFVSGATIEYATLHNLNEIKRKDIRENDVVIVRRAGDVIPEVVSTRIDLRNTTANPIEAPNQCPACHSPVIDREGFKYCNTPLYCPAQQKARLLHFVSQKAMDIDGFGEKLIHQLVDRALVKQLSDLYRLTEEQLVKLQRIEKRIAQKLLNNIIQSKQTTFERFLYSLSIPSIGIVTARKLSQHFMHLEKLMQAMPEELEAILDIGPIVAQHIHCFFTEPNNRSIIQNLLKQGIVWPTPKTPEATLAGKSFVLTGTLISHTRDEICKKLEDKGAKVNTQLSKKTNYLVVGSTPGSKIRKASQLKIITLSESDLLQLLQA